MPTAEPIPFLIETPCKLSLITLLDLQIAKVGNAGFHHFQVHFHEIVLYPAGLGRSKNLLPIQTVLSYRRDFLAFRRPSLYVHGNEAAGILGEIIRGLVAAADGGDLKLELDQLRIKEIQQQV